MIPGVLYSVYEEIYSGKLEVYDYVIDDVNMTGILNHLKAGRNIRIHPSYRRDYTLSENLRERAAIQLSRPTFKFTQVDGVLDMADFSRRDRKCRIDPAIGAPVVCTFGPEHESDVQVLIRQPVRVSGMGKIQPGSDRIDTLEVQKIEPLPSLHLGEGNFFMSPSLSQLAASQGVGPLKDVKTLSGMLGDDEVEDFISAIYTSRESN